MFENPNIQLKDIFKTKTHSKMCVSFYEQVYFYYYLTKL